ncbi:hypothetical protein AYO44_10905 [Planctomycetaceae bacterium SCGC AG-212-F19]|nr:hypothetical protein AYO44_10905 [Planctomycetaceae bacterium SCGC AG-212-F19]
MNERLAELLERYHNGAIDPAEVERLAQLLDGSAADRAVFLEQALFEIHLFEALAERAAVSAALPREPPSPQPSPRRGEGVHPVWRRMGWASVAAVLLMAVGATIWYGRQLSVPGPVFARFEEVHEDTVVIHKEQRLPAHAGQILVSGQGVATGVGSEAVVKLEDSARLKLGSDTTVYTTAEADDASRVVLEQGDLMVEVAQSQKRKLKVETPMGVAVAETDQTTFQLSDLPWLTVIQGQALFTHKTTGKSIRLTQGQYVAVTQEGDLYAARLFPGDASVWTTFNYAANGPNAVAFSPDGKQLAAAVVPEQGKTTVRLGHVAGPEPPHGLPGSRCVAFSPDGKLLAAADRRSVLLYDVATQRQVRVLPSDYPLAGVRCLAFSPDGQTLALGRGEQHQPGDMELWDVATGTLRKTWRGHVRGVTSLAFSPDGQLLATGSHDKTLALWDLPACQERIRQLMIPAQVVWSLAFAPDGKTLAIATGTELHTRLPGEVKLWDVATETVRATLRGHTRPVTSVVFSADSQMLVTGSADATVRFWDLVDGREYGMLKGHKAAIGFEALAVALSPDGNWLATASYDRTVKVWKPTWIKKARAGAGSGL